jgi:hypothetical protein
MVYNKNQLENSVCDMVILLYQWISSDVAQKFNNILACNTVLLIPARHPLFQVHSQYYHQSKHILISIIKLASVHLVTDNYKLRDVPFTSFNLHLST